MMQVLLKQRGALFQLYIWPINKQHEAMVSCKK